MTKIALLRCANYERPDALSMGWMPHAILTEKGEQQADAIGGQLVAKLGSSAMFASSLLIRAQQTAFGIMGQFMPDTRFGEVIPTRNLWSRRPEIWKEGHDETYREEVVSIEPFSLG